MDMTTAVKMLSALAQEFRQNALRLLAGSDSAGQITRQLPIQHNTLWSKLSILSNAGLIASHHETRPIIYHINFNGTRELLRQSQYPESRYPWRTT